MVEKELINTKVRLEKFPGKGGWTYAVLPSVERDKHSYFGWLKVSGFIDEYELKDHHLMPMSNGKLFLSVNATVRKKINKKEGDIVSVKLYREQSQMEVPAELLECLGDEPVALKHFEGLSDTNKERWIDYIQQAGSDEGRIERMATAINRLAAGEKDPFAGNEADSKMNKKKRR